MTFRGKTKSGEWVEGDKIQGDDGLFILERKDYTINFIEPDYHSQGMGCGLEDRNITDRYDAMLHGFERCVERCAENHPPFLEILPDSLSMSTGLTDKNGKMIFGSIPVNGKMSKGGDVVGGYPHGGCSVRWCEEYACFESVSEEQYFDDEGEPQTREATSLFANDLKDCKDEWEVTGNQYEGGEV